MHRIQIIYVHVCVCVFFKELLSHHLWYLQLRKPLNMSLREPMWCRLSRMTTVGSSVSVSSELHCSARVDRY